MQIEDAALEVLNAWDTGHSIPTFTGRGPVSMDEAYAVTLALRDQRTARGERHLGRKIGFTNTTIWERYNVNAPIWGDMWDRTVFASADAPVFDLDSLLEPRLEPEIVFGLSASPTADMAPEAVLACCEWVAHGVELVQSPFANWQFEAADTVIAGGLHGALIIGERQAVTPAHAAQLAAFTCTLCVDGAVRETGASTNVLGGPLQALAHLAGLLAQMPALPPLRPGEIITTGTLTDAYPVAANEHWETRIDGLDVPGLSVRFV